MEFSKATENEIPALVQLVNSAYRGDSSKIGWTTEDHLLGGQRVDSASLHDLIQKKENTIFFLRQDDVLLGCVYLEHLGTSCYLGMLTVAPHLQGQGIGKRLLQKSEDYARSLGCTQIEMTVIGCRHELIAFYERQGFARTGKTKPFPYDDERFGIPKRNDLYFEVLAKQV